MPNTQKKIWLSSPHMGGREEYYVQEAFRTNWIAPLGPNVNGFEADLTEYTGAAHAAALSSGTAAIHLALIMLGVKAGDVVLCQSLTFSASANPIVYQGGIPAFVDSEADSWNMCPRHLERAIESLIKNGKRPKAIVYVHLYGMPAKVGHITDIARHYGIPLVEDAAEALGSAFKGKKCGLFGKLGVLSFNGNKIITTSGGGALLGEDEEMIQQARFLATQARDPAPHYQHSRIGHNYRLSNVLAGIGRGQMEVLPERIEQRRANYERYRAYFEKWNEQGFHIRFQEERPGAFSNRWLSCILLNEDENKGLSRETIRLALEADDIEARPLWKPMHLQPVFKNYSFYGEGTAERLFDEGLCLPSGTNLTEEDFGRIFAALDDVFQQAARKNPL